MAPMVVMPMAMMPMAVAVIHLYQQVALGRCGFGNGGLRRDGRCRGRSKQRCHSYDGCGQGHLRQHSFPLRDMASSSHAFDPQPFVHVDPELSRNARFIRYSPPTVCSHVEKKKKAGTRWEAGLFVARRDASAGVPRDAPAVAPAAPAPAGGAFTAPGPATAILYGFHQAGVATRDFWDGRERCR